MVQKSARIAWKVLLAYGIYTGATGLLALVVPQFMSTGQFESFTGTAWAEFAKANAAAGDFIRLSFRFLGGMMLLVGMFKVFIALYPYRKAESWSWWTTVTIGAVAYGVILPYSLIVGEPTMLISSLIGIVLWLVVIILPARAMLSKKT